jgi:hypothetical protein
VTTPQIGGPQKAAQGREIDTTALPGAESEGSVQILANAGQKLKLRVFAQAHGLPGRAPTGWLGPLIAAGLAFLLLRMALVPVIDLGGRAAAVQAAATGLGHAPTADSAVMKVAGSLALPWPTILVGANAAFPAAAFNPQASSDVSVAEFRQEYARHLVRSLTIWIWWIGAVAGAGIMWRRGGPGDVFWGVIAGSAAGFMGGAILGSVFLVLEIVPHTVVGALLSASPSGAAAWIVWVVVALLCWTVLGALLGALLAAISPLRTWLIAPLQRGIANLCRVCRLHALERLCLGDSP